MILQNAAYNENGQGNGTGSYHGTDGVGSSNLDYVAAGAFEGTQGLLAEGSSISSVAEFHVEVADMKAKTTEISTEQVGLYLSDIHHEFDIFGGTAGDYIIADSTCDGTGLMWGRAGADSLTGGGGLDRLFGQAGDDVLTTSGDGDYLNGAKGANHFVFTSLESANSAIIANLTATDVIDLSAIDTDAVQGGDQGFTLIHGHFNHVAGEMKLTHGQSDHTFLKIDLDGDGQADHAIRINGGDHTDFDNFVF